MITLPNYGNAIAKKAELKYIEDCKKLIGVK